MALKDIFKNKKESSEKKEKKIKAEVTKKEVVKTTPRKEAVKTTSKKVTKSKKVTFEGSAYRILKCPHITEKATILSQNNQYVFIVYNDVNKIEIKKAIEMLYGVKVLTVQVINIPKKKMRVGRTFGWKKAFKKAIVRIKNGQKIEETIQ